MKRSQSTRNTPPKKQRNNKSYIDIISDKLYEIGFKKHYISKWISSISGRKSISILIENIDKISEDIDDILLNMRKKFRTKYEQITDDIRDHYSIVHLVQIIVEYANGEYDPISTNSFIVNENEKSKWFTYRMYDIDYKYYNAVNDNDIYRAINSVKVENNHQLFYHATTWKNVGNIIKNGPQNKMGRACLDFGIKPSFYITPDIDTAIQWARKFRFNDEGGIVVFSVDLNKCRYYKEFQSATDEWRYLVKNSRLCKDKTNELDSYYFVYGPMLQNWSTVRKQNIHAQPHTPIKWQMASKQESSDKFLRKHMIGAIYLKQTTNVI